MRYHQGVQGHIGAPELFVMFGVSLLVFKEKWQKSFDARPGITIICFVGFLLLISFGFPRMK
jgi:hypothetical protein